MLSQRHKLPRLRILANSETEAGDALAVPVRLPG